MKEFELKYGCNPNQKPAKIYMESGAELPIEILSGRSGYINFLDAFNAWQLVAELKEATGMAFTVAVRGLSRGIIQACKSDFSGSRQSAFRKTKESLLCR